MSETWLAKRGLYWNRGIWCSITLQQDQLCRGESLVSYPLSKNCSRSYVFERRIFKIALNHPRQGRYCMKSTVISKSIICKRKKGKKICFKRYESHDPSCDSYQWVMWFVPHTKRNKQTHTDRQTDRQTHTLDITTIIWINTYIDGAFYKFILTYWVTCIVPPGHVYTWPRKVRYPWLTNLI